MPQHITVVNYDPDWPRQFQAEAARIRAVLGDNCTAICHFGSKHRRPRSGGQAHSGHHAGGGKPGGGGPGRPGL